MKIIVSVHVSPNYVYFIDRLFVVPLEIFIAAPVVFSGT